ncbi:hypothetical protein [Pedobacter sp. Leaf176]|nr:hypothetical protein [Pedobacter sp. Leaf176]
MNTKSVKSIYINVENSVMLKCAFRNYRKHQEQDAQVRSFLLPDKLIR